jgi:hypothetical protein
MSKLLLDGHAVGHAFGRFMLAVLRSAIVRWR